VVGIDEMELQLRGTGLAPGEITFSDLEVVAHALQLVAVRVGRHLTDQEGPGRATAAVQRATELRLRGLAAGSTTLEISIGERGALAEWLENRTVDEVFDVVSGIATDRPPTWTTPLIGEAAVSLIDALAGASTECELLSRFGRHPAIRFTPRSASRSV
jgi:hypothetical protein